MGKDLYKIKRSNITAFYMGKCRSTNIHHVLSWRTQLFIEAYTQYACVTNAYSFESDRADR